MKKPTPKSKSISAFEYARVAAALGKSRAARRFEPEEIALDGQALTDLSHAGYSAHKRRSSKFTKLTVDMQTILRRYNSELVAECDPADIIFGIRFLDGSYADMHRHIFKIL